MSSFKFEDINEDSSLDSNENVRILSLQVVSGVGSDVENVKRAAALDIDSITGSVAKLGHALVKARYFLNTEMPSSPTMKEDKFGVSIKEDQIITRPDPENQLQ